MAILEKINQQCPHVLARRIYQTGFKKGKSTAIHASQLLNEVHGRRKRKFYLFIDLKKAYDSVDRTIFVEVNEVEVEKSVRKISLKKSS
jgi:hypothetical protein